MKNLKSVVKYLTKNGFDYVVQQPKIFPRIIAWRPFVNVTKQPFLINTQFEINKQIFNKQFIPFFVSMIEYKKNNSLSKVEKEKVNKLLKEGHCDVFAVAYEKKNKLEFQEITLDRPQKVEKETLKTLPTYLG